METQRIPISTFWTLVAAKIADGYTLGDAMSDQWAATDGGRIASRPRGQDETGARTAHRRFAEDDDTGEMVVTGRDH